VKIFGIDPGSVRTGYGCVESDGSRHRLMTCGALATTAGAALPERLHHIHRELLRLIRLQSPDCVVVENLFHARNVRSALVLGHARGVAVLAAVEAGVPVLEYTPAEIKMAVVGYGRAEKPQVQQMVKLLLGLDHVPAPHDAADALAVAICHAQSQGPVARLQPARGPRSLRSWRHVRARKTGTTCHRRRARRRLRRRRAVVDVLWDR
jgi:crossover junction endodeoxyribonuclease RuvC